MIVHILTGSKGGIGKTRCAISLSMYYLLGGSTKPILEGHYKNIPNWHKLNVFGANSNNIDFFTIMSGKDFQELAGARRGNSNFIQEYFSKIVYKVISRSVPFSFYRNHLLYNKFSIIN